MKTFNKIFLTLGVVASMLTTSCVKDLDLTPTDPSNVTDVSGDMDRVLADVYMNFSTFGANGNSPVHEFDGGMASFQRAMFIAEEIPTDEASWLWDPADYGTMNNGIVTPALNAVFGFYSRLSINISLCNQFIASVNNGTFVKDPDETDADFEARKADYVRQCRILRAGCYFYMLSFYSKVPYMDENTPMGALPTQMSRREVFDLVTTDLEKVVTEYPANQKPHYGFVGLDAAESILAKLYLNAEVFAGEAMYDKCYQHSKAVIDRLGHGGHYGNGLAYSYQALFGYNNDKYVVGNGGSDVNEIIWTLAQDRVKLISWSGATFMCVGWLGTNGVEPTVKAPKREDYASDEEFKKAQADYAKLDDWKKTASNTVNGIDYSYDPDANGYVASAWYNCSAGWKCMVARKAFVNKFEWDDDMQSESKDRRVALWLTSKYGFPIDNPSLKGDDWGKNGYLAVKYSNWAYNDDGTIDFANTPAPSEQIGGDYAQIRLAEVYLMAAEAILKGGGGSQAEALKYVNFIRQRAYADDTHNLSSLTMRQLQDERCRELYTENNRRTDLIRWNQWCTGYNWEWKGGLAGGTNLPEYTKCYPIPNRVMVSSDFEQTPGY